MSTTRAVLIDGVRYDSIRDAAMTLKVEAHTVMNRTRSQNPLWDGYQFEKATPTRKVSRAKGAKVVFRGKTYNSVERAAEVHGITPPSVRHHLRDPEALDCHYLSITGQIIGKDPPKEDK